MEEDTHYNQTGRYILLRTGTHTPRLLFQLGGMRNEEEEEEEEEEAVSPPTAVLLLSVRTDWLTARLRRIIHSHRLLWPVVAVPL